MGVLSKGSDVVIADSIVLDTLPFTDMQQGPGVLGVPDGLERANLTLRGSVVDGAHFCGVCGDDSNLVVERTVVRNVDAQLTNGWAGMGIRVYGFDLAFSDRPTAELEQVLVEETYDSGIYSGGAELKATAALVRDIHARVDDGTAGRGINIRLAAFDTDRRSDAIIDGCRVERAHEVGIYVAASGAAIDSCAVFDTQAREVDGLGGTGMLFIRHIAFLEEAATATLDRSVVEQARGAGITVVASDLIANHVVVRDSLPQDAENDFGDGVVVSATMLLTPGLFPTQLDLSHATIQASARAGVATFAAPIALADSLFDCNGLDLNGESDMVGDFAIDDLGGNVCGCVAEQEQHPCQVLSSGLTPPTGF
jgi:hypothetical protein